MRASRRTRGSRARRWVLRFAGVAGVVVIVGGLVAVVVVRKMSRPPGWWRAVAPVGPEVAARAEALEEAVTSATTEVRGGLAAPWMVAIDEGDLNAWLAERFEMWAANRSVDWPAGPPRVRLGDGIASLGAEVSASGSAQVVSIDFAPAIDAAGALVLHVRAVRVGELAVPVAIVRAAAAAYLGEDPRIDDVLEGRPVLDEASLRLADGRVVRLVELRVEPGRVIVGCTTTGP